MQMKNTRKLSRGKLTELCRRVVFGVQDGESPEGANLLCRFVFCFLGIYL